MVTSVGGGGEWGPLLHYSISSHTFVDGCTVSFFSH